MRACYGAVLLLLGCRSGPFACEQDDDCSGGNGGVCELSGWCSFADEECASGRRYGKWAGDGLAHECVPPGEASGTSDGSSGDPSGDPTTLSTSASTSASTSVGTDDSAETTSPIDPDGSSTDDPTNATTDDGTTGPPLDEDLVVWYRFDEDGFPGVVLDDVGGHDGACADSTCPAPIQGPVAGAAEFSGDVVHVAADAELQVQDALTVALWLRIDAIGMDEYHTLASKPYAQAFTDTWEIGLDSGGNLEFYVAEADGVSWGLVTPLPGLDTWIHLAATYDGMELRLYIDGELVGVTAAGPVAQDDHGVTLGAGIDNGLEDNFLAGALDDFRLYRRALGDAEIAELATP